MPAWFRSIRSIGVLLAVGVLAALAVIVPASVYAEGGGSVPTRTRLSKQENESLIRRIALEEGVDPELAIAIARQESGLDNLAVGDSGHSVGLFQLHDAGMGAGMGAARYDPETNARTALRALAQTARTRPGLDPGSLAAASQRPADPTGYARSVNAILARQQGLVYRGPPGGPDLGVVPRETHRVGDVSRAQLMDGGGARVADTSQRPESPVLTRRREGVRAAQAEVDRLQAERDRLQAALDAPEPSGGAVQGPGISGLRVGDRPESAEHRTWREARRKAQLSLPFWDDLETPEGKRWRAAQDRLSKAQDALAEAEPSAAPGKPTSVGAPANQPYLIERDDAGNLTYTPNINYTPPAANDPEARQLALETARINLARAQQQLAQATSPEALEAARLANAAARVNLDLLEQRLTDATSPEARRAAQLAVERAEVDLARARRQLEAEGRTTTAVGGRVFGIEVGPEGPRQLGEPLDLRTGVQRAQEELTGLQTGLQARRAAVVQQAVDLLAADPGNPDVRRRARQMIEQIDTVLATEAERRAAATEGRLSATFLSDQTGTQYEWDPDGGTVRPVIDPTSGQPRRTAKALQLEAQEARLRAGEERAGRAQAETERAARVAEQQAQATTAISQQRADEEARANVERELTARTTARTGQQQAASQALADYARVGVAEPGFMANVLGAQAPVLGREGIQQVAQQMGVGAGVLGAVLSGYDAFERSQQALRAQQQPVRRAPDLTALPPVAPTAPPAPAGVPPPPPPPAAPAAPPVTYGNPILPGAYDWTPQPPGGPLLGPLPAVPPAYAGPAEEDELRRRINPFRFPAVYA